MKDVYANEVDTVAAHLTDREAPTPSMTLDNSLGQRVSLDAWRADIGLVFDREREDALARAVRREPLARKAAVIMPTGRIESSRKAGFANSDRYSGGASG